ncbi:hypothetical protein [Magnetospirillum moscoviense]|uniref:ParE-like toxin domain-containing protein n=1 Tax=Magnetospirillum moscoviense TaxID=1437059 RepID=A0A178MGB0_9PROT|nr:hypothetical protein [Magnetospirillum moscoviense]OAN47730.1 hypothetical protein A6A05_15415 [Magnetospirillum moscoviense]
MISRTTRTFWKHFDALPLVAQRQGIRAYALWRADPFHTSLHFKCVSDTHGVWSARIGLHWRALGTRDGDEVVWFWIGSHADYDRLL